MNQEKELHGTPPIGLCQGMYKLQNAYSKLMVSSNTFCGYFIQIGGMFDTIQRTHSVTGDWAHILNKLIYYGKLTVIPSKFVVISNAGIP